MPAAVPTRTTRIRIGNVDLDGAALLAPLSGITDVVMRRIARRYGASAVVSEMVASDQLIRGEEDARLRMEGSGVSPHIVQLAGREPAAMAEAARLAQDAGAAIIDINMGCPAKKVTGGYAGAALMRDSGLATRLIDAVVGAVDVPVTVKMRLGWCHDSRNAPELAHAAVASGARMITVHARTRQQFYAGAADWSQVAAVRSAVSVPLIVNGDIGCAATAHAALAASGADGVMLGRAALGRPWLVGIVAASLVGRTMAVPSRYDRARIAIEHYRGLIALYGPDVGVRHARKHLAAYAQDLVAGVTADTAEARRQLVTSDDPDIIVAILETLGTCREWEQAA